MSTTVDKNLKSNLQFMILTHVTLIKVQDHQTQNKSEPKQGYNHTKFNGSSLKILPQKKPMLKVFVKSENT